MWSELFPAEQARIVQLLVERVDLSEKGADITLRIEGLASLMQDLRTAYQPSKGCGMKASTAEQQTTITVHVPMTFTIRGGRKTIISESAPARPQPRIDNALLKALARAHRWRRKIESGEYASITELAKAEGVNESYACRLLRLTLLAPSIVTEILDGRQTSDVMLKQLMKPLPVRWDEQMAALKMSEHV